MKSLWKTLNSKIVHRNPWWKVRRDNVIRPDGREGEYYVVEIPNSVFVIPIDERGRVVLLKQYRYPTQRWSWEIVAGQTDGEPYPQAAKRELEEETGLHAERWKKIGTLDTWNAVASEIGHIFLAQGLSAAGRDKMAEESIIEIKHCSHQEVKSMIRKGSITDMQTLACLSLYWSTSRIAKLR